MFRPFLSTVEEGKGLLLVSLLVAWLCSAIWFTFVPLAVLVMHPSPRRQNEARSHLRYNARLAATSLGVACLITGASVVALR